MSFDLHFWSELAVFYKWNVFLCRVWGSLSKYQSILWNRRLLRILWSSIRSMDTFEENFYSYRLVHFLIWEIYNIQEKKDGSPWQKKRLHQNSQFWLKNYRHQDFNYKIQCLSTLFSSVINSMVPEVSSHNRPLLFQICFHIQNPKKH